MKYIIFLILSFFSFDINAFINLNKCNRKIRVGLKLAKSKINSLNSSVMNKYINKDENKFDYLKSTINESSEDFTDELSELFSLATDTNKEFLYVFQQILNQYLQINIIKKIDEVKKPIDIYKIIIKNIIIPTAIHDSFQLVINSIHLPHH